jgi:hypothetical protein
LFAKATVALNMSPLDTPFNVKPLPETLPQNIPFDVISWEMSSL